MNTYLILGGNPSSREKKVIQLLEKYRSSLKINRLGELKDLDILLLLGPESISIETVRNTEKILSLKPYQYSPKIVVIQADLLTYEAQTAMLKTLEEPPGQSVFLLFAPNANLLLPTILSRCSIVYLPAEPEIALSEAEKETETEKLQQLLSVKPTERLLLADEWGINKDRESATRFCQIQMVLWREILLKEILHTTNNIGPLTTLKSLTLTLTYLKANVNPKLAVDNYLLGI